MSVPFFQSHATLPTTRSTLSNTNARELLTWLGYTPQEIGDLYGVLPARELAARCRRRLWPEARNVDPALVAREEHDDGHPRLVFCGRPAGYLRDRTAQLLSLAERAGEGVVSFA
ncbi:hypothetical protein [Pyxidicoccus sp. MSG2]|uniref:hypothetical protein n=1 Tax=Pyxidicoccus sp. MSG2 TaxID=2996790 RepID=UPI00226F628E|nr:hypothetical protein [Pyxidicoccus sp. MSG2]MCY1023968.1 hypothetical protein [Pyxidicoccus sp. MSG2]